MAKQWDEITITELLEVSSKERSKCLKLAEQAIYRKDDLSRKALVDRSNKHGDLYHAIKPLIDEIGEPETVTIRALLDVIERDRLSCLELEKEAFHKKQAIAENAFRRQGNHYELLYQDIMYFVNKICPAK
jgi:hypothetical protein